MASTPSVREKDGGAEKDCAPGTLRSHGSPDFLEPCIEKFHQMGLQYGRRRQNPKQPQESDHLTSAE